MFQLNFVIDKKSHTPYSFILHKNCQSVNACGNSQMIACQGQRRTYKHKNYFYFLRPPQPQKAVLAVSAQQVLMRVMTHANDIFVMDLKQKADD